MACERTEKQAPSGRLVAVKTKKRSKQAKSSLFIPNFVQGIFKFQVFKFVYFHAENNFKHNIMVTKLRNVEVCERKPMGLKRVHTPSCKRYF